MSFQAYIDNIKTKTGKSPDDFKKLAEKEGFMQKGKLNPSIKATQITNWLKKEFGLGHGHAMAIYATFKGKLNDKKQRTANIGVRRRGRATPCKQTL